MVRIEFTTFGSAFDYNRDEGSDSDFELDVSEVVWVIENRVVKKILEGNDDGIILDRNGNSIGRFDINAEM